jgi:hypothetical protein
VVTVANGAFIMESGGISYNILASGNAGGGVYVASGGRFIKTGGTISGNMGKQVYAAGATVSDDRNRNNSAGETHNVDTATDSDTQGSGFWVP